MKAHIAAAGLLACLGTGVWAQSGRPSEVRPTPQAKPWTLPHTEWGAPDFQGATWNFATMTPLVRPADIEKAALTEAEAATFEQQFSGRQRATTNNGYDWWDGGAAHLDRRRTSLIVDPADGHVPPLTPEAQRRAAALPARTGADGPEDFALNARCLWFQNGGTPIIPSPYNNNLQFIETRDYVVISTENIHDARIVPMDGRPHGVVRRWMGDARGRWERDTLVIDTTNFSPQTSLRGSDENLHIVERFTQTDADVLDYQFTADDPTVWTRPWTAMLQFRRTNDLMYEFACHEGNLLTMQSMLKIARRSDKP